MDQLLSQLRPTFTCTPPVQEHPVLKRQTLARSKTVWPPSTGYPFSSLLILRTWVAEIQSRSWFSHYTHIRNIPGHLWSTCPPPVRPSGWQPCCSVEPHPQNVGHLGNNHSHWTIQALLHQNTEWSHPCQNPAIHLQEKSHRLLAPHLACHPAHLNPVILCTPCKDPFGYQRVQHGSSTIVCLLILLCYCLSGNRWPPYNLQLEGEYCRGNWTPVLLLHNYSFCVFSMLYQL